MTKEMLTVNISPKVLMTETFNYKLHCENHNVFGENTRNLYFLLVSIYNIVC